MLEGRLNALYGISLLRKICNHPDLLKLGRAMSPEEKAAFGDYRHSAKLVVLHQVEVFVFLGFVCFVHPLVQMLPLWKEQVDKKKKAGCLCLFCEPFFFVGASCSLVFAGLKQVFSCVGKNLSSFFVVRAFK